MSTEEPKQVKIQHDDDGVDINRLVQEIIERGDGWYIITYLDRLQKLGAQIDAQELMDNISSTMHPDVAHRHIDKLMSCSGLAGEEVIYEVENEIGFVRHEDTSFDQDALETAIADMMEEGIKRGISPNATVEGLLQSAFYNPSMAALLAVWVEVFVDYCDRRQLACSLINYGFMVVLLEQIELFV